VSSRRECCAGVSHSIILCLFFSVAFSRSTLVSIHDFMLKAAQTKWISRLVAKTSIQDALMQFDQQLRDASMSFQVRALQLSPAAFRGSWGHEN
jgi:hypothetical protein